MKFQVVEMKHLFELTKDEFFNNQMLIWTSYTNQKKLKIASMEVINTF